MLKTITDLETFLLDNEDRIFRYWVFKRMFTPYEVEMKFTDESVYENIECSFGRIVEAVELGNGDWLLGIQDVDMDGYIEYYRLSEIRLAYDERDRKILEEEGYGN